MGTFLLLHEEVQETMLEELVAALPVFASGVLGLIPTTLMERDDGVGDCAEIKFRAPHAIDAASSPNLTHCVISTQVRTLRV